MNAFMYYMPTRIVFGDGALNRLHEQALPGKRALIVISAGKSMKASGMLARVQRELEMAGVGHVLFDRIQPNPVKAHVMEGAQLARDAGCDFVIGLGGGSSMDSAKSIAVMAANGGDYWDYIGGGSGKGLPVPNKPLPIVTVTTTAGTGSESDPWTVITDETTGEKIGFGYDGTFPTLSIVDPELMHSVPPALTAYQGFDALFHSTEGYLNKTASEMSDLFALKAIALVGRSLAKAVENGGDAGARADVALANTLSGFVETVSGCISEHSLEHALSGLHPELPHGAGLIMISRAYYAHFARSGCCDGRMVDMARALGRADAEKPMDFVDALVDLQKACRVDSLRMTDYGISPARIPEYVAHARHTMGNLFAVDPVTLTDADCAAILEQSFK